MRDGLAMRRPARLGARSAKRSEEDAQGNPLLHGVPGTASALLALQRSAGNAAVVALLEGRATIPVIQREFEDGGETGQEPLAEAGGPVTQPDLGEDAAGGGSPAAESTNEFGDMDGSITGGMEVHAFSNAGQTATSQWHHAGGAGGVGNEVTGSSVLVAPGYDTRAAASGFVAWIRQGTGTVRVRRSWTGVPQGNNGVAHWAGSGGGLVYIAATGVSRIGTHEAGHVGETRRIHDARITPLERRLAPYRGAGNRSMAGATAAAAIAALQAHIRWNPALTDFSNDDTATNQAGGTFDTTDQARANFYHNKGPRAVGGVNYGHYIEAP